MSHETTVVGGIDEAGLGPLLGPLVVSGVAFDVPTEHVDRCLWKTLHRSCTSQATQKAGRRVIVADSKRVYHTKGGLAPLERTVLVMLALGGHRPATWRELLDVVSPGARDHLDAYPWYAGVDFKLPVSDGVGDIGTQANALRSDCARHDVALRCVCCEILTARTFNRLIGRTRNKSIVLMGQALRVADRLMKATHQGPVRLHVDRLGGRVHYREALMTGFQHRDLRIVEESESRSAYRMMESSRACEISFVTAGDAKLFLVALASLFSKYVRELHMLAFNRYWCERVQNLKPTAGYYTDARRWLEDIEPTLRDRPVDRSLLVRVR